MPEGHPSTQAEMLEGLQSYQREMNLRSTDPTARVAAVAELEQIKAKQPIVALNAETVTEAQFREGLGGNQNFWDVPANAEMLAEELTKQGLHPDRVARYKVITEGPDKGRVPPEVYAMAQNSKAMHLADREWMAKFQNGNVDAKQRWAAISYILSCGPAKGAKP